MRWLLVLAGVIAVVAIGYGLWFLSQVKTVYAPGYTSSGFSSVKPGDTEICVVASLGRPFRTNRFQPFVDWIYSAEQQPNFAKTRKPSGSHSIIRFTNGCVVEVWGGRMAKRGTNATAGTNDFLRLTASAVEALSGVTQDVISNRFGPPRAVYEFKAVKSFYYSRAAAGGFYRNREITFDAASKVVQIDTSLRLDFHFP